MRADHVSLALAAVAAGLWAGAPAPAVAAVAAVVAAPDLAWPLVAVAVMASASRRRSPEGSGVAPILLSLAGEVRAGRSLRTALAEVAAGQTDLDLGVAGRLAAAGRPMAEVASALRGASPALRPAAAALEVSARTGGKVAEVFEGLALDAVDEAELRRQVRTDSAPARLSAMVVAGFPLAVLAAQLGGGGIGRVASMGPVGAFLLAAGLGLLLLGVGLTVALLARSSRHSKADTADEELVLFSRVLLVGLSGGLSLHSALLVAVEHSHGSLADEVRQVVRSAGSLGLARALMAGRGGMAGALLSRLAASQVSGAPMAAAASSFLADVRSRIRNDRLRRARRLPVQLMFPLGLLILPGFILVFAGPLIAGSLVDLFGSLP
jgi:Flp pilus assembly protein TadB